MHEQKNNGTVLERAVRPGGGGADGELIFHRHSAQGQRAGAEELAPVPAARLTEVVLKGQHRGWGLNGRYNRRGTPDGARYFLRGIPRGKGRAGNRSAPLLLAQLTGGNPHREGWGSGLEHLRPGQVIGEEVAAAKTDTAGQPVGGKVVRKYRAGSGKIITNPLRMRLSRVLALQKAKPVCRMWSGEIGMPAAMSERQGIDKLRQSRRCACVARGQGGFSCLGEMEGVTGGDEAIAFSFFPGRSSG